MQRQPNDLESRIAEFRPQLRLGLDIGEWAGGIAVVRGCDILHAETYTDYHHTTLVDRRRLRRGRRTRRAKKARLARLRSWILRQALPDGSRLPDPYELMRRKEFQCQPGEYRVGLKKLAWATGKKKQELPTWVEAVKSGARTDAAAFVVALTHIFQKRGFKWSGSDLREMTDDELAEELNGVRLTKTVAEQVQAEIDRRRKQPEPDFEGKIEDLAGHIERALGRPKQPRVAEHRSIVEDDLRAVVETFTGRLCPNKFSPWFKGLRHILNKPIRHARFENRVSAGCSWCGKNTPRKWRPGVREKAYRGAVMNLLVDDHNSRRPLTDAERQYFLDLWAQHENPKLPSRVTLEKKLAALHSQVDMARQLHELLTSPAPGGRTNLCGQHLGMQAEGAFRCNRHVAVCKRLADGEHAILEVLDNVGPAARVARNPCREAHDERLVRRIEEILFDKNGTARFGAVPSLVTIEFPKPHTAQVYECPGCHEKLALDLRVRFRVKGIKLLEKVPAQEVYGFACPACGIVLQVKASRPITIRGQRRQIPVTLKNTDAFLRRAKGGLKEKKKRLLLAETQGTCVYCGARLDIGSMEIDHIFPQSRGGPGVDSNLVAVCHDCNHPDTGKGGRTPWEWKGQGELWDGFDRRISALPLPLRKRQVLLCKDSDFPENPTALARAGARPRQFIERLKEMLLRHGVPAHQIADNYEPGKLTIQMIDGWMTTRLRRSWLTRPDGSQNFPEKNDLDLHNHAQDAALIAACPPHTWRERIFAFGEYSDQAPPQMAPNWKEFFDSRDAPLVHVLGNYRPTWKRSFADEKFCQDPRRLDDKRQIQYLPLREFPHSGAGPEKERHPSETFIISKVLDERFRSVAESLGLKKKQTVPLEKLADHFPGIRHVKASKQKGGELAVVRPHDGPPRKIQLKGGSEAVVFWRRRGASETELQMSVQWPKIFEKFGVPRHKPGIPQGTEILDTWERYKMIWLDQTTGHRPGFYRVKEFTDSKVTVLPENAVTDELARRMGLRKQPRRPAVSEGGPDEDAEALDESGSMREIVLGKADLLRYFTNKKGATHAAGA